MRRRQRDWCGVDECQLADFFFFALSYELKLPQRPQGLHAFLESFWDSSEELDSFPLYIPVS